MRLLLKKIWFFSVVAVVGFFLYLLSAGTHLYGLIAWSWIRGTPSAERQRRVGIWMLFWSDVLFTLFCMLLRIKLRMRLPLRRASRRPCILIANHRATVETLMLPLVLRRLGYRCALRGIAKRSFKNYWLVGHAVRLLQWAFVERRKDDETPEERTARKARDLGRVTKCAQGAREVGACIMIYPEGALFREPVEGSGLRYHLPPFVGGMARICQELPDFDVLSITMHWGNDLTDIELHQATEFMGRTITIDAEYIPHPGAGDVAAWINGEWRRKDAIYALLEESPV